VLIFIGDIAAARKVFTINFLVYKMQKKIAKDYKK